jgi:uncharacterized protein with ParB-like and HNH nuclease domain
MPDIFVPESLSIKKVFDSENYYQIPSYQRPYSWENEQIDELWDDLFSAYEEKTPEYFLGSIIVAKNDNSKYLEVIDGQQRLTTPMILFCVLRDLYYKNHTDSKSIIGRIKSLEDEEKRLKLRTQPHHQNKFEQEILNEIDFNKKRKISDIKSDKFINAALRFKDKIDMIKSNPIIIDGFKDYLLNNVKVILVKCSNPSFAMKLFEVLNNRGLDLTAADIIKSNLMSNLKEDDDWKTFEQEWISIEEKAEQVEENLNNLFTYYEYYLLAKNPKRSLQDELRKEFNSKNPLVVINEFKQFLDFYFSTYSEKSKVIYSLYYLTHDVYWKSIILTAKMKSWDDGDFNRLGKILRKFYYLYWIAEYTTSKTKQTSFNIISWIKEGKDVEFISEEINKKLLEDKILSKVLENLRGNIYDYAWCKPLLILLEYEQADNPRQDFMEINRSIQVEHILPRENKKDPYWLKNFTKDDAEHLLNTMGNLTLLSGKKNIAASCNSFPSKIKNNYEGQGEDGLTGFILTQKIVNETKQEKELLWNKDKINNRQLWMLKEIEKIFQIKFNDALLMENNFSKLETLSEIKYNWDEKGILLWRKPKLAASDVEKSPDGNPTGRLKFVKSGFEINNKKVNQTTYFRYDIFGNLNWSDKLHSDKKELADGIFALKIFGKDYGLHKLTIGHNPFGEANQNNYTTHLSWGNFGEIIKKLNLIGKEFLLFGPGKDQKEPFYIEIR